MSICYVRICLKYRLRVIIENHETAKSCTLIRILLAIFFIKEHQITTNEWCLTFMNLTARWKHMR